MAGYVSQHKRANLIKLKVRVPKLTATQRRQLDPLIGGGSVAYCGSSGCHTAASSGFNFPNGIIRGKDGLYYIPNTVVDKIKVMKLQPDLTLQEVDVIHLGMPVDNLSLDKSTGDIYAAAFPRSLQLLKSFENPYGIGFSSTIWRIRQSGSGYEIRKVLEDGDVKTVGGATVAVHDAKTGRLFMGGMFSLRDLCIIELTGELRPQASLFPTLPFVILSR